MTISSTILKSARQVALAVATITALFADASAATTKRAPKAEKNLLTIENMCKPNSVHTIRFGASKSNTKILPGPKLMILPLLPDRNVVNSEAKISEVEACDLQDHLTAGLQVAASASTPHIGLVILSSKGEMSSDTQILTIYGNLDNDAVDEEADVSQQEITGGFKKQIEKSKANALMVFMRGEDHGQVEFVGTDPTKKNIEDARAILVRLIKQHQIEEGKRLWALADRTYYALTRFEKFVNPNANLTTNELVFRASQEILMKLGDAAIEAAEHLKKLPDVAKDENLQPQPAPTNLARGTNVFSFSSASMVNILK